MEVFSLLHIIALGVRYAWMQVEVTICELHDEFADKISTRFGGCDGWSKLCEGLLKICEKYWVCSFRWVNGWYIFVQHGKLPTRSRCDEIYLKGYALPETCNRFSLLFEKPILWTEIYDFRPRCTIQC